MENAQKLHEEFIHLGSLRHKLKNRMLLILPEIYESGIWKKYAGSIIEYAGKYGDIAKSAVIKRLRLEKNLDDKPCLRAAIEKVGVHKVAMVVKIATPETDKLWAGKLENMSKMAVQSLSKEMRVNTADADAPLCKAIHNVKKIELDEESNFLFLKLKSKLGKNLTDKEFLKLILEERAKQEFPKKQNKSITGDVLNNAIGKAGLLSKSITGDVFNNAMRKAGLLPQSVTDDVFNNAISEAGLLSKSTRYISVHKKRQIIAQTGGKCAYPGCNSPYEILHHRDRYSESRSHNSVIPLCKIHHEFAHNNLIKTKCKPRINGEYQ